MTMEPLHARLLAWRSALLLPVLLAALAGCTPPGAEGDECSSSTAATADTPAIPPLGLDEAPDPLTLRRQTLIVRDIEKSLLLYRDAIGMEVIYDNIIRRPHRTEDRQQEIRLVFLKANNDFIGVLGLVDYEYNNPEHPVHAKPVRKEGFTPGNSVLLFNTTQLEERWPKIEAVEGVEVIGGPTYTEYPSYDGSSIIRVNVTRFYDADGFLVEFNQPLDPIH
ncbi:MAG: VOC family protein [Gammaproteobacteria bacterium]|nr:VOC family protein [Gammaproteobacteria bacterium]MDE0273533.1 VOC family protein [Gammaproteobacteria bacterium]